MKGYYYDKETAVVDEVFAVIYSPLRRAKNESGSKRAGKRRARDRYPENCVTVVTSSEDAIASEKPDSKLYAARVLGPARSSEGLRMYYLLEWLTE